MYIVVIHRTIKYKFPQATCSSDYVDVVEVPFSFVNELEGEAKAEVVEGESEESKLTACGNPPTISS